MLELTANLNRVRERRWCCNAILPWRATLIAASCCAMGSSSPMNFGRRRSAWFASYGRALYRSALKIAVRGDSSAAVLVVLSSRSALPR
jgi:hypothetical protein